MSALARTLWTPTSNSTETTCLRGFDQLGEKSLDQDDRRRQRGGDRLRRQLRGGPQARAPGGPGKVLGIQRATQWCSLWCACCRRTLVCAISHGSHEEGEVK